MHTMNRHVSVSKNEQTRKTMSDSSVEMGTFIDYSLRQAIHDLHFKKSH